MIGFILQILSNDNDDDDDDGDEKKDDGAEAHPDLSLVLRDVSATQGAGSDGVVRAVHRPLPAVHPEVPWDSLVAVADIVHGYSSDTVPLKM